MTPKSAKNMVYIFSLLVVPFATAKNHQKLEEQIDTNQDLLKNRRFPIQGGQKEARKLGTLIAIITAKIPLFIMQQKRKYNRIEVLFQLFTVGFRVVLCLLGHISVRVRTENHTRSPRPRRDQDAHKTDTKDHKTRGTKTRRLVSVFPIHRAAASAVSSRPHS